MDGSNEKKPVLIIGGGFSGVSAAIEIMESSEKSVVIVEKNPYIGGRVLQMYKYFPKLCPPFCGFEINLRRIKLNEYGRIRFITSSEIEDIRKEDGSYKVKVRRKPQYINDNCTICGDCVDACPETRLNDFNYDMDSQKAIYLPNFFAYPAKYVIDDEACKLISCKKCMTVCRYDAINLEAKEEFYNLDVESVILATGWRPYDANNLTKLGFGRYKNVITNVMMERLSADSGPTGGEIIRPSDNKTVNRIAFVQCAGSRDENHLPYCSSICCMASLKQALYVREKNPDSEASIFYIDLRTPGKYEKFLNRASSDEKIKLIKGKVANITEESSSGDLILEVEDMLSSKKVKFKAEMVVLATGMVPNAPSNLKTGSLKLSFDENGFLFFQDGNEGIFSAGVAKNPMDVNQSIQSATAGALSVLQYSFNKRGQNG